MPRVSDYLNKLHESRLQSVFSPQPHELNEKKRRPYDFYISGQQRTNSLRLPPVAEALRKRYQMEGLAGLALEVTGRCYQKVKDLLSLGPVQP